MRTRSQHACSLLPVVDDASICHPEDLWGLSGDVDCPIGAFDECGLYHELEEAAPGVRDNPVNPTFRGPQRVRPSRDIASFVLSHNEKTRICFSEWFASCWRTSWCRKNCYGNGPRHQITSRNLLERNYAIAESLIDEDQAVVDALADCIVQTCDYYGLANIRWHGVGDLHAGSNRVAISIATRYPHFTLWGFTRKPQELGVPGVGASAAFPLPVLPNLVFWCSVDRSMNEARLQALCNAARMHGTGLAYSSEVGKAFRPRASTLPRVIAPALREDKQPSREALEEERVFLHSLSRLTRANHVRVTTSFGYHGKNRVTHLGFDSECPATDPLGGGHFYAACQVCRWCMTKEKGKRTTTLKQHRVQTRYRDGRRWYNLDQSEPVE